MTDLAIRRMLGGGRIDGWGEFMPQDEMLALLTRARAVLDRYLFDADSETMRDDVAEDLHGDRRCAARRGTCAREAGGARALRRLKLDWAR